MQEFVQSDQSLRWAHSSFYWFCSAVSHILALSGLTLAWFGMQVHKVPSFLSLSIICLVSAVPF